MAVFVEAGPRRWRATPGPTGSSARAVRFSTLTALCEVLDCRPGDLLDLAPPR